MTVHTFETKSIVRVVEVGETKSLPAGTVLELEVDSKGVPTRRIFQGRVRRLNVAASPNEGAAQDGDAIFRAAREQADRLVDEGRQLEAQAQQILADAKVEADRLIEAAKVEAAALIAAAAPPPPAPGARK